MPASWSSSDGDAGDDRISSKGSLAPEPEPEPEPEPDPEPEPQAVGHSSTQVLVEVLKASGRIVELCVGFRAATVRGSPHPLSREQAALGSFFVEAAYQAGLQQPAPGGATVRGRGPEPAGHGGRASPRRGASSGSRQEREES